MGATGGSWRPSVNGVTFLSFGCHFPTNTNTHIVSPALTPAGFLLTPCHNAGRCYQICSLSDAMNAVVLCINIHSSYSDIQVQIMDVNTAFVNEVLYCDDEGVEGLKIDRF